METDSGAFHCSQIASTSTTDEDAEYVKAVMSPRVAPASDTQKVNDKRKRQPSKVDDHGHNSKKLKNMGQEPSMSEIAELIKNLDQSVTDA